MLRRAVKRSEITATEDGRGPLLESAIALLTAASVIGGFFAERRASEVAQLVTSNVDLGVGNCVVNIRAVRQNTDRVAVGQLASLAAIPFWGNACPVRLAAE